jgi:hypothetical protein
MKWLPNLLIFCLLLSSFGVRGQDKSKQKVIGPETVALHAQILSNLSSLNQQIKTVDSATVRIFLLLKMSDFIWRKKIIGGQNLAESVTTEAVEDFQKNKTEIPSLYQNSLQADALALLRVNVPVLYKKKSKEFDPENGDPSQSYKLAAEHSNRGTAKAIDDLKNRLVTGNSPANIAAIIFIVRELLGQNKVSEVNSILETVLASQEQTDTSAPELLLFLNENFLAQTTPITLQKRFLSIVIAKGQRLLQQLNAGNERGVDFQTIYIMLRSNLPQVLRLLPSDYPQALVLVDALQKRLPQQDKEREEIAERIKQSKDKLAQTISEAKGAENKTTANDLWQQAAELALREKKYQVAVDCVNNIDSDDPNFALWREQFLDDEVTKSALENNDVESAEYAISKIESKLRTGTALLRVVKYHHKNKNAAQSQIVLAEAVKKIKATDNNPQKVRSLSEALYAALPVDNTQAYEIAQSIVKTTNSLPSPNMEDKPQSETRKKFVQNVQMVVISNIFPTFQRLAKQDSSFARSLANELPRDYRVAALFGVESAISLDNVDSNSTITEKTAPKN